jgi:hypothetical protein
MTKQQIPTKLNQWHDFNNQEGINAIVDKINEIISYLATLEERLEKVEGVGRKSFCGTCLEGNDGVYRCIVPGCPNKTPPEKRGNSNLRDNADGTCNCRPFMGGCFFTDGFDGRCACKCHTPTSPECEHKHRGLYGECLKCTEKLDDSPTEVKDWERIAMNIVYQLADEWNVPVSVRQATNDKCIDFIRNLLNK